VTRQKWDSSNHHKILVLMIFGSFQRQSKNLGILVLYLFLFLLKTIHELCKNANICFDKFEENINELKKCKRVKN